MVPSKLFGILAAGRPALYIGSPDSEISKVVVENDCGRSVRQGDVDGLVAAIEGYAGDPAGREAAGDRARKALVDEHGARHRLAAWRSLLERVVSEGRPSPEGGSRA